MKCIRNSIQVGILNSLSIYAFGDQKLFRESPHGGLVRITFSATMITHVDFNLPDGGSSTPRIIAWNFCLFQVQEYFSTRDSILSSCSIIDCTNLN